MAVRTALLLGAALGLPGLCLCAETAAFPPTALVCERDLAQLIRSHREVWLAPTAEEITARQAQPEDAVLRDGFAAWLRALVAGEWLPADGAASAAYLKVGSGRESRAFSCFYMAYRSGGASCMVKGYFARTYMTIVPDVPLSGPSTAGLFEEARALQAALPAGKLGVPQSYESATRELRTCLRRVAERYVNPRVLPTSEGQWEKALALISVHNGGFQFSWPTHGYGIYLPGSRRELAERESALCSVWTNGTAVRFHLEHPFMAMDAPNLLASIEKPVPAATGPLNPGAVELWDMRQWYDAESAAVSDPARATYTVVTVVVKEPYAPRLAAVGGHEMATTEGQPSWGSQVLLPLDSQRWHLVEFWALSGATELSMVHGGYYYQPESFAEDLGLTTDRESLLDAARERRDGCAAVAARSAGLRYPPEVKAERDEVVAALEAEARVWDQALAFWDSVVQSYPDASETFYRVQGENLEKQLEAAGLTKVAERVGNAVQACGVPLFERYGLQNPR